MTWRHIVALAIGMALVLGAGVLGAITWSTRGELVAVAMFLVGAAVLVALAAWDPGEPFAGEEAAPPVEWEEERAA